MLTVNPIYLFTSDPFTTYVAPVPIFVLFFPFLSSALNHWYVTASVLFVSV